MSSDSRTWSSSPRRWIPSVLFLAAGLLAPALSAQVVKQGAVVRLEGVSCTRVADPKLAGGGVEVAFIVGPPGIQAPVVVEALSGDAVVATIFAGVLPGQATPHVIGWNGRATGNGWLDPGDYVVRVRSKFAVKPGVLDFPLRIVRLGVTLVRANDSGPDDEFQMVYYRKGSGYGFYATPSTREYLNVREPGETSDLDLNDGSPRPAVPIHADVAEPVMEGSVYEGQRYNYPVCYLAGTQPRFLALLGTQATAAAGTAVDAGYPLAGHEIRPVVTSAEGAWTTTTVTVTPGGTIDLVGPALPAESTRHDRTLTWRFESRATGASTWTPILGSFTTSHRFYTLLAPPKFAAGVTGTQYSGPWVEVADQVHAWQEALATPITDEARLMEVVIKGFFGQQGTLPTAIEGVVYDAYPLGGDGGANHYFNQAAVTINLSALLNGHANGKYVNCSDCAGATSAICGMMGVADPRMVRLGPMTLNAIWGIGSPAYTKNLWGGGSHSFSYHHIITRDGSTTVSDACMCLDEDGQPQTTPGIPGYNCDRPWVGTAGYNALSCTNNVNKTLETLPRLN